MYRVMAVKPAYLETQRHKIKAIMQGLGKLDSLTKEIVAIEVSSVMGCDY